MERPLDARLAPHSTYRLQFGPHFSFDDARAIVPYLARLGIGHLYASPYLKARPGSEHGYDVVDPNALNPEIGTPAQHGALCDALRAHGLGHILDFVPNHMGVGGTENPWWQHVLEWGEASPFSTYFDIDWRPLRAEMRGKVLVPFLGDYYGYVLERGELVPTFDAETGTFSIAYFERRFPIAAVSYGEFLAGAVPHRAGAAWPLRALAAEFEGATQERTAELKAELASVARDPAIRQAIDAALAPYRVVPGDPAATDRLDALLQRQHYRLAYWRVSADEINYRRFFDINDLAGLRVEDAEVLAQTHRFIFELIESGRIQGLRIDHIDGLFNPGGYCTLLQDRAEALGHPQYLVVEKILARFETLREDWRIDGTTGYDFMNEVCALFVDAKAELAFDRIYRRFAGIGVNFDQFAYRAKKDIMRSTLASELEVLATMLDRIAENDRRSSDYTYNVLKDAIVETIASFPVYRTYVTSERVEDEDRTYLAWATGAARKRSELGDERVFDLSRKRAHGHAARAIAELRSARGPALRDEVPAIHEPGHGQGRRGHRVLPLRPAPRAQRGGRRPAALRNDGRSVSSPDAARAAAHPHALLATATHDHKRGEDVRTRIAALSEMPGLWERSIRRWNRLNDRRKTVLDDGRAPTENDEYGLYQVLLGTFPAEWLGIPPDDLDRAALDAYVERIQNYLRKALREAKFRTSWSNPNAAYEDAALGFVRDILTPERSRTFFGELQSLARECATVGALSSLAQTTLKLTVPGVPDIYQGCEFWDLSLVDPDNRRAVDYALRTRTLDELAERVAGGEIAALASDLLAAWPDGRVKAYVTWRLLQLRRERPAAFGGSSYAPLETTGKFGDHVVAFLRDDVVVVVPRLVRRLMARDGAPLRIAFGNERVRLPASAPRRFVDRFTGKSIEAASEPAGGFLNVPDILRDFPVAVLVPM
jgi:(1->4)-alpha-D-glucan 1-alpha-D-glucosylmutase